MWRDEQADPPTLVRQVGSTKLGYQLRCIGAGAHRAERPDARRIDSRRYEGPAR
ncbi:MAG: DUF6855 family protein [Actinomycetota bacterium]